MKIAAMIPVRKGSERLKEKNYLRLDGMYIYEHAIVKAKKSGCFDHIFINSEDQSLRDAACNHNIEFFHRNEELATSCTSSDQVVANVIEELGSHFDFLYWVNTASPLSQVSDITGLVDFQKRTRSSSVVTVRQTKGHLIYKDKPLNFSYQDPFARTQDMQHALELNYALMGWSVDCLSNLKKRVLFDHTTDYYQSSTESNILLKSEEDFCLIKNLYSSAKYQ